MTEYIHDFDLCFSITNGDEDPDKITCQELKQAVIKRIEGIPDDEWREACCHILTEEY